MSDCVHHWILESPSGPTTKGECKLCYETKEFPNVNDTNIDKPERKHGDIARLYHRTYA